MSNKMTYPTVARRFSEALNDNNMNQLELARRCGIGRSSVSHYINGTHCPSNSRAGKLGRILGVNPAWLMGFDVDKYKEPEDTKEKERIVEKFSKDDEMINIVKRLYNLSSDKKKAISNLIEVI